MWTYPEIKLSETNLLWRAMGCRVGRSFLTLSVTHCSSVARNFRNTVQYHIAYFLSLATVLGQRLRWQQCMVKVKQSHYRPGQALGVPGGWGFQISRHSAHEGGKVISPTLRLPLFLVLNSVRGCVDSRSHSATERIMSMKNSNDTLKYDASIKTISGVSM
jgi:hypothetical protein